MRGSGRIYKPKVGDREGTIWWTDFSVHRDRHRESTHTKVKAEAQRLLRQRMTEREAGRIIARPEKISLAQLREMAERQYVLDGRRSLDRLRAAFDHLVAFFDARARAPEITPARIDAYATERLAAGAARATVNYEKAALRRAFRLAIEKGLLATMPVIKLARVRNARTGFFEEGEFAALMIELPAHLQPVVQFLRLTGWRRSEALGLTWDQIDWEGEVISLAATDTKGGEPRIFPFGLAPELKQLIEGQWVKHSGIFVFQCRGDRIGNGALRSGWKRATKRAGLEGRLVHDLRRSAARDLRRAGVSEGEIMRLCGWRTRAMFDRYNIIDEQDLARAVAKRFANGKHAANTSPAPSAAEPLSSSAAT